MTDRCNLRCGHCWVSPQFADADSPARTSPRVYERAMLAAKSLGVSYVKFTGGEPLLYPHLKRLIRAAHLAGMRIGLETNGTLLTRDLARFLAETKSGVSVSLDGATPASHDSLRGVRGAWDMAVRGLRTLVESGCQPGMIMAVHGGNFPEIPDIAALAKKLGATSLKINPVAPLGRGGAMAQQGKLLRLESLLWLKQKGQAEVSQRQGIPVYVDLPCAFDTLGGIAKSSMPICPFLNLLSILANGDITFCGLGYAEPSWVMGNIHRDDLAEVWHHHPLLRRARAVLPDGLQGVCGKCLFRRNCLGKCRASAMHAYGDLTAPDPHCQTLYERGAFPTQRLSSLPDEHGETQPRRRLHA